MLCFLSGVQHVFYLQWWLITSSTADNGTRGFITTNNMNGIYDSIQHVISRKEIIGLCGVKRVFDVSQMLSGDYIIINKRVQASSVCKVLKTFSQYHKHMKTFSIGEINFQTNKICVPYVSYMTHRALNTSTLKHTQ